MNLSVLLHNSRKMITCPYGSSLIYILEKSNMSIESQCREGFCGSCRTNIIRGAVHYPLKPIAFISKNEILPCCCNVVESIEISL
jgi:ferredoxin